MKAGAEPSAAPSDGDAGHTLFGSGMRRDRSALGPIEPPTPRGEAGMINRRSGVRALVGIGGAGLAAGCLSSNSGGSTSNGSAASGPGKTTIEVMYGLGPDTEPGFKADVSAWAAQNKITVKFTKSASWDTEIRTRVQGGNPPDVGLFPQPGLMCDLAKQKKLIPYDDATVATDKATLVPGLVDAGTCADGKVYGLPNE